MAGTYLIMPSLMQSKSDTLMMDFSMTSPTLNPSTRVRDLEGPGQDVRRDHDHGRRFRTARELLGHPAWLPQESLGRLLEVAIDPSNGDVWMADEYIPSGADGADTIDNWGTRVWQVTP